MTTRDTAGLGTSVAEGNSQAGVRLRRSKARMAAANYELSSIDPIDSSTTENGNMNRLFASIAGLGLMTTANLAWADCESTCEANCLFLGDPGSIGLCIASCPATCAIPPPVCDTTTGTTINRCSTTAITVTPSGTQFTIKNDNTGGSAKAFMTLTCKAFPNSFTTPFKGSKTVNPGGSTFVSCGAGSNPVQVFCGRANTCSGGVN
jgi:hypothetical protein